MRRAVEALLVLALAASCVGNAWVLLRGGPEHATLPVFVPASLAYERQLRGEAGQPAGQGGAMTAELARWLLEQPLDAASKQALAPKVEAVRAARERLLDARNRRHALNIRMMDVGVAVGRELRPEQWDHVHMNRDAIKAAAELQLYDRLRDKLR